MLLWTALALFACKQETPAAPPLPAQPAVPASAPVETSSRAANFDGANPHEPTGKKNQIAYKDARCSGMQPCECVGTIEYGQNALARIGVSEDDLARGTPCLLGDFDGNGFEDAAFLGKDYGKAPAAAVTVLLFDDVGLRSTLSFPKKVATLAVHSENGKVGLLETQSRLFFVYGDGKFDMKRL